MKSLHTLPYFTSLLSSRKCPTIKSHSKFTTPQLSFSPRRRSRRHRRTRRNKDNYYNDINSNNPLTGPSFDYESINLVLDLNQISILSSAKSRFHQFLSSSREAYTDLKSVITVDQNGRVLVTCRRSTLQFVGSVLFSGFVLVFVFRVLVRLGLGFKAHLGVKRQKFVVRRDRSLGGKEVVVAVGEDAKTNLGNNKVLDNPLSPGRITRGSVFSRPDTRSYGVKNEDKLPKWWPVTVAEAGRTLVVDKEDYQREANRLIRAMIDQRTSGLDIVEDDIIQLRRICRTSGVRVSISTENTRDSFYRAAVNFVLNVCSRAPSYSTAIHIDGEDARQFVAGLADSIGLEHIRAARMVSGAVAARTRSSFLQAWALEVQGNHSAALMELSKICLVHRVFPPKEFSPEMEMVARGLEKILQKEQRELLMKMLVGVCGEESHRSAAEALGLVTSLEGNGEQYEKSILEN